MDAPESSAPTAPPPLTRAELKNHDLREVYKYNDHFIRSAHLHAIPLAGISLTSSAMAENANSQDQTADLVCVDETPGLDTFLRIIRALLAFGLQVRVDENDDPNHEARIMFQTLFWMDLGRDKAFDQSLKALIFYIVSGGERDIEKFREIEKTILSTDTLMDLVFNPAFRFINRDEFQLAWYRYHLRDRKIFREWLSEAERVHFSRFKYFGGLMADLSANINKAFELSLSGTIFCQFPPFLQINTRMSHSSKLIEPPWNFILEAWFEHDPLHREKRKEMYKLLMLWRKSNDAGTTDDCIILDPTGHKISGGDWSFSNSIIDTEIVLFYYRVDYIPGEKPDPLNDIQLNPALAKQWEERRLELEELQQRNEKPGDQTPINSPDSQSSGVTWSVSPESRNNSPK